MCFECSFLLAAWKYASMADADWGWKKRAARPASAPDADLYSLYKKNGVTSDFWKRYGQSFYQPYQPVSYSGYQDPYSSSYGSSSYSQPRASPLTSASSAGGGGGGQRSANGDRQYSYHSMADMDWGWKRKRSGKEEAIAPAVEPLDENVAYDLAMADLLRNVLHDNAADKEDAKSVSKQDQGKDVVAGRQTELTFPILNL